MRKSIIAVTLLVSATSAFALNNGYCESRRGQEVGRCYNNAIDVNNSTISRRLGEIRQTRPQVYPQTAKWVNDSISRVYNGCHREVRCVYGGTQQVSMRLYDIAKGK